MKKSNNKLIFITQYKEPLKSVVGGFGYYGAIIGTEDGEYIQCHRCGKLFKNLGCHIKMNYEGSVREYKEEFGLALRPGLVSEKERDRLAENMRIIGEENGFTNAQLVDWGKRGRKARRKDQPELTLETLNKRGTCEQQLLGNISDLKKKLKKLPTSKQFTEHYTHHRLMLVYKTFGSWNNAVSLLK